MPAARAALWLSTATDCRIDCGRIVLQWLTGTVFGPQAARGTESAMRKPTDKLQRDLPASFSSEAPPVLLPYQQRWLAIDSPLKVGEKSRRIGLTWAEAADDVLIAAKEGGQNVYYIGYNQDMAIEYVEACAMWARAFNRAAAAIEEGLWDGDDDEKHIKTYTIRFPDSGRRIVALSSRPANLRGKQGVVVIDEAAFHDKLDELLKAALALLIWGGKVRVLSTHNGNQNAFNELIQEIRGGKRKGEVFRTTFKEAVQQGLYRRVCLRLGKAWTSAAEAEWVKEVYAFYGDAAAEELDVIPKDGAGRYLSRALVERVADGAAEVLTLALADEFTFYSKGQREREVEDWCDEHIAPRLARLDRNLSTYVGGDFARSGDASVLWPAQRQANTNLKTPFVIQLRNVPHEQQAQVAFYLIDRLPRFTAGAFDGRGNGEYLAEVCAQRYGSTRIAQVKASPEWYRQNMPRFKQAFEDATATVPKHEDIYTDLLMVEVRNGLASVPDNVRKQGTDGRMRHGDAAIAMVMMLFAAATMDGVAIEFQSLGARDSARADQMGSLGGVAITDDGFGTVSARPNLRGF